MPGSAARCLPLSEGFWVPDLAGSRGVAFFFGGMVVDASFFLSVTCLHVSLHAWGSCGLHQSSCCFLEVCGLLRGVLQAFAESKEPNFVGIVTTF